MSTYAFTLVATAGCLHALWNLMAKRVSGNLGVFWLSLCAASVMLAPFAVASVMRSFETAALPCMVATALLHAAYFALLSAAYRHGELSTVYPLARGTGVAGTALAAHAMLQESLSTTAQCGIALVCGGIVMLGIMQAPGHARARSWSLALLVGVSIAAYSIVDRMGVMRADPVVYVAALSTGTAIALAPLVLGRHQHALGVALRDHRSTSVGIGVASMGTYLVVLYAMRQSGAASVVAVREISVAVATMLGVVVLKEPLTRIKVISAVAILAGVMLVKAG